MTRRPALLLGIAGLTVTVVSFAAFVFGSSFFASDRGPTAGAIDPDDPTYGGLEDYERRCERINRRGALAQVVYEESKEMKVGDSDVVRAAVTLDQAAPPDEVLPRTDAAGEPGVVVSCRMQARLVGSEYEFEVNDSAWIERSLLTDEARWDWIVTPKLGGDQTLTLQMRPIVMQRPEGGGSDLALARDSNVRSYTTNVHVDVPWTERPATVMTQTASLLNVSESLVKALTGLIVALTALWAAVRVVFPRLRRRHRAEPEG
jgi:hypothetical protein